MQMKCLGKVLAFVTVLLASQVAWADGGVLKQGDGGWLAIAIALGIGLAAMAGAFGQARTASAALEGIARNPNAAEKLFVPMLLGLAFIESLVLFTWVLMLLMKQMM
jgi:F-type H+-transporting ATPase subunit c